MSSGTKIALSLGIAAVLIAGLAYGMRTKDTNAEPATETASGDSGRKMAFADLARQGGTFKCDVTQKVNGVETAGTVYMDKGLLRGEFKSTYGGKVIDATFIVRDGYTYLWNSALPGTGFKLKNDAQIQVGSSTASAVGSITASPNTYLEQIGDYDCKEWAANASLFVPPASITFQAPN